MARHPSGDFTSLLVAVLPDADRLLSAQYSSDLAVHRGARWDRRADTHHTHAAPVVHRDTDSRGHGDHRLHDRSGVCGCDGRSAGTSAVG